MIHARGEYGFMENALLLWQASSSTWDCKSQINFEDHEKWLREKLTQNVHPKSVDASDNI
jgi:hypothetical protein